MQLVAHLQFAQSNSQSENCKRATKPSFETKTKYQIDRKKGSL